ncbi:class I SAM-dependent methyltransferase [Streptacidiphilus jiangxiensis]|uniref:Ubiquinone/menaquinone biosynthesis C-methylase UbiE n=1 Tax=Streptacidiphilus jiangxiensis TaxID=235985 RepID=A0A1H7PV25_STRJI|nr:class I SAM-dependent methyltransferase [Streptacidiphilus jiangxiensis]SEL39592.1 Ubiquinone/menaquinone biosynthesis C-methylase UbiE [Streptacidiphilus jiangxiensis]
MNTQQTAPSPGAQAAESYLRAFHDNTPGLQSQGVEAHRAEDGRTSYEVLADRVGPVRRVLDLGCADGALLALFAGRGAQELAGVDLSSGELEIARRRPELADAHLHHGRAQQLPFPDDRFDAVVSHMAFMLMADVDQVAAEAARVLAPGGTLAVAVGGGPLGGDGMDLFLDLARPYLDATPKPQGRPRLGDPRSRKREGLDEILTPFGFAPVEWLPFALRMDGTPEEVWQRMLDTFYDVTQLDATSLERLHQEFLDAAAAQVAPDGRLPSGLRINLATTRLAAVQDRLG